MFKKSIAFMALIPLALCLGVSALEAQASSAAPIAPHTYETIKNKTRTAVTDGTSQAALIEAYGEPSLPITAMQASANRFDSLTYYYDASGAFIKDAAAAAFTVGYSLDAESKTVISHGISSNEIADT